MSASLRRLADDPDRHSQLERLTMPLPDSFDYGPNTGHPADPRNDDGDDDLLMEIEAAISELESARDKHLAGDDKARDKAIAAAVEPFRGWK